MHKRKTPGWIATIRTAVLATAAAVVLPGAAIAQAFPTKPITIVLSYAAGGPTDFLARTLAEKVSAHVGQPVLVDPKPGANERVATEYLLRQPADGYTMVLVALPHATNPAVFSSLPYDSVKEFAGLIHLVNIPVILSVKADSPIRTFADFVAFAKAKPGEAMFGSPGAATSSHLTIELLGTLTNAGFTHIPYKGDAPAMTELMGGRIVASVNSLPGALGQIRGARVRAIGISSANRVSVLPDVPTFAEQGYPAAITATWFGLIIRSGTPKDVVAKLNTEFNAALAMPDVKEKLSDRGMTPVGGSPESFTAFIRSETERWTKVVKARGIKIE
ncbi:MAG: tripartite tricarboxylate transporter substrate binding protein [Betaproteobacteria bacterium]